uniref:K channel tetramerisation domain-containing protein n=1 Tax=Toxoplasma gondii COUG TaxID=1074873 RepID=A0A2G8Y5Q0_TOXGO|nr:hypothetical protein TGCOUG_240990 [Toxoplasma gondii COUG]
MPRCSRNARPSVEHAPLVQFRGGELSGFLFRLHLFSFLPPRCYLSSSPEMTTPASPASSGTPGSPAVSAVCTPLELLCPRFPFPLFLSERRSASSRSVSGDSKRKQCASTQEVLQNLPGDTREPSAHARPCPAHHRKQFSSWGRREEEDVRKESLAWKCVPSCTVLRLRRLQSLLRVAVIARCMHEVNKETSAERDDEKTHRGRTKVPLTEIEQEDRPDNRRPSQEGMTGKGSLVSFSVSNSGACAHRDDRREDKTEERGPLQERINPVRQDLERMQLHLLHPKHRPLALLFRASRGRPLLLASDFPQRFPDRDRALPKIADSTNANLPAKRRRTGEREEDAEAERWKETTEEQAGRNASQAETQSLPCDSCQRRRKSLKVDGKGVDPRRSTTADKPSGVSLSSSPSANANLEQALESVLRDENVYSRVSDYLRRYFQAYMDRRTLVLGVASASPSSSLSPAFSFSSSEAQPSEERPAFVVLTKRRGVDEILGCPREFSASSHQQRCRGRSAHTAGSAEEIQIPSSSADPVSRASCPQGSSSQFPSPSCSCLFSPSSSPSALSSGFPGRPRHCACGQGEDERIHFSFDHAVQTVPLPLSPLSPSVSSLLQKLRGRLGRRPERRWLTPQSLLTAVERLAEQEAWRRIAREYLRSVHGEEAIPRQNEQLEKKQEVHSASESEETKSSAKKQRVERALEPPRRETAACNRIDAEKTSHSLSSFCSCDSSSSRSLASCSASASSSSVFSCSPSSDFSGASFDPRQKAAESCVKARLLREPLPIACAVLENLREEFWAEMEKAAAGGHDPLPAFVLSDSKTADKKKEEAEDREVKTGEIGCRWPRQGREEQREDCERRRSASGAETGRSGERRKQSVREQDWTTGKSETCSERDENPQEPMMRSRTHVEETSEMQKEREQKTREEGRPKSEAPETNKIPVKAVGNAQANRQHTLGDKEKTKKDLFLEAQVDFLLQMYLHTDQILRHNT